MYLLWLIAELDLTCYLIQFVHDSQRFKTDSLAADNVTTDLETFFNYDASTHKLECWTPAAQELVLYPEDPFVAALLGDPQQTLPEASLRDVLPMGDAAAIARWLLSNAHRFDWAPHQGFDMGAG